jgi:hypothetical protein
MIFCATIVLCSCQPALINIPKLPDCPKPVKPVKLEMPPPIPDNMAIEIKDGRIVKIDDNGANLIRMYHDLRKAIKAQ